MNNEATTQMHLYAKDQNLGKIVLNSDSKHTKEFRSMLLPNESYFDYRDIITQYFSDVIGNRPQQLDFSPVIHHLGT